jgi:hypothetical protein
MITISGFFPQTQSSTPSVDMQPDAAPSFADFKYDQCYSAISSSSSPISLPMQEALADEERIGKKRKRKESQEEENQENPRIRTKYDFDIKKAAYWRIAPDQNGYLQLCDKRGNVLHTEKVINDNGKKIKPGQSVHA